MFKDYIDGLTEVLDKMVDAGVDDELIGEFGDVLTRLSKANTSIPLVHPVLGLKGITFPELISASRIEELEAAGFTVTFEDSLTKVTWD